MLLIVWYCFSIIGFNVHTCNASGRSFIATFIGGLECSDIHPEHHHCDCHSCHHSEDDDCCHDDHMSLGITGLFSNDDHQEQDFQLCGLCVSEKTYGFCALTGRYISEVHDSGPSVPIVYGDVQSLLSIWRI